MTKTEAYILRDVKQVNDRGALCGLGVCPTDPGFGNRQMRFIKRLHDAGLIVWIPYTPTLGAGWATPDSPLTRMPK